MAINGYVALIAAREITDESLSPRPLRTEHKFDQLTLREFFALQAFLVLKRDDIREDNIRKDDSGELKAYGIDSDLLLAVIERLDQIGDWLA